MAVMFLSHEKSLKITCWSTASLTAFSSSPGSVVWYQLQTKPPLWKHQTSLPEKTNSVWSSECSSVVKYSIHQGLGQIPQCHWKRALPAGRVVHTWTLSTGEAEPARLWVQSQSELHDTVKPCLINKTKKQSSTSALLGCGATGCKVDKSALRVDG